MRLIHTTDSVLKILGHFVIFREGFQSQLTDLQKDEVGIKKYHEDFHLPVAAQKVDTRLQTVIRAPVSQLMSTLCRKHLTSSLASILHFYETQELRARRESTRLVACVRLVYSPLYLMPL